MTPRRGEGSSDLDSLELCPSPQKTAQPNLSTSAMALNLEQSPFFQQQRAKGEVVVKGKVSPDSPELR